MIVTIPACDEHQGLFRRQYDISDRCPRCGARRGVRRWQGLSFDGSRRLTVDCWANECGHVDTYAAVRAAEDAIPIFA